ncbi:hypothetical protein K440DRAFT_637845 [Wilcoxina mikolae CBS 423.85]|nr:hypothetical protein K440DRAFT_637845 [Wilcoxina mikolae CBS 423.85]
MSSIPLNTASCANALSVTRSSRTKATGTVTWNLAQGKLRERVEAEGKPTLVGLSQEPVAEVMAEEGEVRKEEGEVGGEVRGEVRGEEGEVRGGEGKVRVEKEEEATEVDRDRGASIHIVGSVTARWIRRRDSWPTTSRRFT